MNQNQNQQESSWFWNLQQVQFLWDHKNIQILLKGSVKNGWF